MTNGDMDRLKVFHGIDDIDAPSNGPSSFFWGVKIGDDDMPDFDLKSAQLIQISLNEQLSTSVWDGNGSQIKVDVSTFANRTAARQAILTRIDTAQIPGLTREPDPAVGELEVSFAAGKVMMFQNGNMAATLMRLGGDADLFSFAQALSAHIYKGIESDTADTQRAPLAATQEGPEESPVELAKNTKFRLDLGGATDAVRAPMPLAAAEAAPRQTPGTAPPEWPVPVTVDTDPIVAIAENGEVQIDGEGLSFTAAEQGAASVRMALAGALKQWTFDVKD